MLNHIIKNDISIILGKLDPNIFEEKGVLVTGGAGFLGSWLCDTLVLCGSKVYCVDNFSTGLQSNIDHLLGLKNFHLIRTEVEEINADLGKFDLVMHFASRASPIDYQNHPVQTLTANSIGTMKTLELARISNATFLYASSSEVYGNAGTIPTPEHYWGKVNPIGSRSCYDEGKRFGEALCTAYHKQHGVDARIARIFNTYGPRLREEGGYGRAISRFIAQALKGEDITVYGDGSQTRSFCYVTDTILGILKLATSHKTRGETINIGNPLETRIIDLAHLVKKLTNSNSKITFHPLPPDDPKRRCPDITKAKRLLNWQPEIPLEEGLNETIEWFKLKLGLWRLHEH